MSHRFGLLVIGGGPAGLSAVRAYRDQGGDGGVAIVTDEHRMPYERPPLSKELLREELEEEDLALEEERWLVEQRVQLIGGRAVALHTDRREVVLSGGRELTYRSCLLATGAEPARLPIPGADDPGVLVLRSLDQLRELKRRLRTVKQAVVIGSGFIGCEIAASLRALGHAVTLVSDEPVPNVGRLGPDAAGEIRGWLGEEGVTLKLGAEVEAIERHGSELEVRTLHESVNGQLVMMATGVSPRSELAAAAGLALQSAAITTDAGMQTSAPGVLAAGDVCAAENRAAGRRLRVEHWGDALGQGTVAGRRAAGREAIWEEVPGFWSVIGRRTLKYAAWGDGYAQSRIDRGANGSFTVWYGHHGRVVGVLAHEADHDYERDREMIAAGEPWR